MLEGLGLGGAALRLAEGKARNLALRASRFWSTRQQRGIAIR
jgi:hypothetical protein